MSDNNNSSSGGIGLAGAVFIVFLILKLLDKIDWSWWWVTSPLWVPLLIAIGILLLIGIGLLFWRLIRFILIKVIRY